MTPLLEELERVVREVLNENTLLRAELAKRQEPQGQREEAIADWLRERGYIVIRPMEVNGND